MAVPDYQTLMRPLLDAAATADTEVRMADISDVVANSLELRSDDVTELLASGSQTVFMNRLHWAKTYMQRAGLIKSTRRGYFEVTDLGKQLLLTRLDRIDNTVLSEFEEFRDWRTKSNANEVKEDAKTVTVDKGSLTPEDLIAESYAEINDELKNEVLNRVLEASPLFFEKLIVNLLISMGYGGGQREMGQALGRTGDGGVDGLVREDELGLDVVYMQAKRYALDNPVAIREIRDFVGSLEGFQATKGVFVTTSYFPKTAEEFISRVSKRVVLIDGNALTQLMIRHNVGVRTKSTYEIKRLDEDFFID